jgi:signal transduction histidine kinase/ligand-binding sensor domain-containing protein
MGKVFFDKTILVRFLRQAAFVLGLPYMWFLLAAFSSSLPMSYSYRRLDLKDGLSQSSVLSILQDKSGFIWMGTSDGLNRYDGTKFLNFMAAYGSSKTIKGGPIFAMAEDNNGLIYVGSYGEGLSVFDPVKATFTHFSSADTIAGRALPNDFVLCLKKHPDGSIWMGTRAGVSRIDPQTFRFTHFLAADKKFPAYSVIDLLFDAQGTVWAATYGGGLCRMKKDAGRFDQFENVLPEGDRYNNNIIQRIAQNPKGGLLLATDGGAFGFDTQSCKYERFMAIDGKVNTIFVDSRHNIWIGGQDRPLQVIDSNGKMVSGMASQSLREAMPETYIETIYEDRSGGIWFGMKSKGALILNLNRKPFAHLLSNDKSTLIPNNSVFAIETCDNKNIWFGTLNGIAKWDKLADKYTVYTSQNSNLPTTSIWGLWPQGNDSVWLGGSNGLHLFFPKTGKRKTFVHITGDANSLCNNEISSVVRDGKGYVWVGTTNGLSRYDDRLGKFKNYYQNDGSGLSFDAIWHIFVDSKQRLWVGTEKGLCLYDYASDRFKAYLSNPNNNSLVHNDITSVRESANGHLWISTRMGVCMYDETSDSFVRLGNGLLANEFSYSAFEDGQYLWVSTNKGIAKVDLNNKTAKYFTDDDGVQSKEFNPPAILLPDGYMLFGGINGVTGFYPSQIKVDTSTCPPLYFTRLVLDKDLIETGRENGDHDIRKQIEFATKVRLDYDEKLLSLGFSALEYCLPQNIRYFYRILPESQEWIPLKEQNYVTFLNLAPGKYEIQVRSTNADGVEVSNTKTLKLVVDPPFWRTWWFKILTGLVVALLVLAAIRYRFVKLHQNTLLLEAQVVDRTKRIETQKREIEIQRNIARHQRDKISTQRDELEALTYNLEEKVKERTSELEVAKNKAEESDKLKSAFLSNMSHEIRTPLNAIIGFSDLLMIQSFDTTEKSSFAEIIRTNGDHLLNLLNDIIDVSMIEAGQLKLHFKSVDVNELLQDVWLSFKNHRILKSKNGEVELVLRPLANPRALFTDSLRLKQVLYNLISNAIKFTERGEVVIEVVEKASVVRFRVSDSGIGIAPEHQARIFERFRKVEAGKRNLYGGFGLGLTISRNLIESLGGSIWVESVQGRGTTFYFTLPLVSKQ